MVDVRPATRDDLPVVGRTLARAFLDDPAWGWLVRGRGRWDARAARFFAHEAGSKLHHGSVYVADEGAAVAIWAPPATWRATPSEILRALPTAVPLIGTGLLRGMRYLNSVEKVHPRHPHHWYLAVLGTDPDAQGRGLGSAVLAPVLERADAEGVPAYLESSKLQNVPFYARHGFAERAPVEVPGAPVLYPMWRDPR